jgi:hypothetical protein
VAVRLSYQLKNRIHAKKLIQSMVGQFQKERRRLEDELRRVTTAPTAFGKVYLRAGKSGRKKEEHFGGRTQENRSRAEGTPGKSQGIEEVSAGSAVLIVTAAR